MSELCDCGIRCTPQVWYTLNVWRICSLSLSQLYKSIRTCRHKLDLSFKLAFVFRDSPLFLFHGQKQYCGLSVSSWESIKHKLLIRMNTELFGRCLKPYSIKLNGPQLIHNPIYAIQSFQLRDHSYFVKSDSGRWTGEIWKAS